MYGNQNANPMNSTNSIIWHIPDKTFEPCHCISKKLRGHSDLVQILLPSTFRKILPQETPIPLQQGAVIFGHNVNFKWHWRDTGDPVKGEPLSPSLEPGIQFHDSGIGSSLGSSPMEGNITNLTESSDQQRLSNGSHSQPLPAPVTSQVVRANKDEPQNAFIQEYEGSDLALSNEPPRNKQPREFFWQRVLPWRWL